MSSSENEAAPVTKAELCHLLTAMVGIQEQIQSMKRELTKEREATNEQLVKCIRLEIALSFMKKGHEKQFWFNTEKSAKHCDSIRLSHR